MSERFDWDKLLEGKDQDPHGERSPVETVQSDPIKEAKQIKLVREKKDVEPPKKEKLNKNPVEDKKKDSQEKLGVLQGGVTTDTLLNAIIMAEILGPPGGLSRRRNRMYYKSRY